MTCGRSGTNTRRKGNHFPDPDNTLQVFIQRLASPLVRLVTSSHTDSHTQRRRPSVRLTNTGREKQVDELVFSRRLTSYSFNRLQSKNEEKKQHEKQSITQHNTT